MSQFKTLDELMTECIDIEGTVAAFGWSDELRRRATEVRVGAVSHGVAVGHLPAGSEALLRLLKCGEGME